MFKNRSTNEFKAMLDEEEKDLQFDFGSTLAFPSIQADNEDLLFEFVDNISCTNEFSGSINEPEDKPKPEEVKEPSKLASTIHDVESSQSPNSSENLINSDRNWDNFRLRRDCFRGFSDYFKKKFKPLGAQWQMSK